MSAWFVGLTGSSLMPKRGAWLRLWEPSALEPVRSPTARRPAPEPCDSYVTVGPLPLQKTGLKLGMNTWLCADAANDAPRPMALSPRHSWVVKAACALPARAAEASSAVQALPAASATRRDRTPCSVRVMMVKKSFPTGDDKERGRA